MAVGVVVNRVARGAASAQPIAQFRADPVYVVRKRPAETSVPGKQRGSYIVRGPQYSAVPGLEARA